MCGHTPDAAAAAAATIKQHAALCHAHLIIQSPCVVIHVGLQHLDAALRVAAVDDGLQDNQHYDKGFNTQAGSEREAMSCEGGSGR
jgi:hypothetical protein